MRQMTLRVNKGNRKWRYSISHYYQFLLVISTQRYYLIPFPRRYYFHALQSCVEDHSLTDLKSISEVL